MTHQEFAKMLSGREYGMEITPEETKLAKEHGLVVVYGYSDDLVEIKGALSEEFGAEDGAKLSFTYYQREKALAKTIEALWRAPAASSPWTFKTDIPHSTFRIMEDGEVFCVGIVFSMHEAFGAGEAGANADDFTFLDYQQQAMRTGGEYVNQYETLRNAAFGLCGESGEVIDHLKKFEFQGHDLDIDKLSKEVGDILWYCALFAEAAGVPMAKIAQENIRKLKERYPDGFDPERSVNRAENGGMEA